MNSRNTTWLALALLIGVAAPTLAPAQTANPAAASAPGAAADMTEGEVRRVDKAAGKVTLKHGEIKNLDMPPMTMVFQVRDKAWLDKLQPGDKVRFKAVSEAGAIVVTALEALR